MGRTFVVTGSASGIGKQTGELAKSPETTGVLTDRKAVRDASSVGLLIA